MAKVNGSTSSTASDHAAGGGNRMTRLGMPISVRIK
jgi:hypothetical protein